MDPALFCERFKRSHFPIGLEAETVASSQEWGLPGSVQAVAGCLLRVLGGVQSQGVARSHSGVKVESDGLGMTFTAALVSAVTALLGPLDRGGEGTETLQ